MAVRMLERRAEHGIEADSAVARLPVELWSRIHRQLFDKLVNDVWKALFRYAVVDADGKVTLSADEGLGEPLGLFHDLDDDCEDCLISLNAEVVEDVYHDDLMEVWFNSDQEELWSKTEGVCGVHASARANATQPMRLFLRAHGLAFAEAELRAWTFSWTDFDGLMRPINITLAGCRCNDAEIKLPSTVTNEAAHWDAGEGPPGPSKHLFIEPAAIKTLLARKPVVRSFVRRYGMRPDWSTSTPLKRKGDTTDVSKGDEPQLMIFGHAEHWCVARTEEA